MNRQKEEESEVYQRKGIPASKSSQQKKKARENSEEIYSVFDNQNINLRPLVESGVIAFLIILFCSMGYLIFRNNRITLFVLSFFFHFYITCIFYSKLFIFLLNRIECKDIQVFLCVFIHL